MEGKKLWFVVVVAMVLMSSCTGSKSDCMKQCITDCADKGGSLCIVSCSVECKWPFKSTAEFDKLEAQAQKQHKAKTQQ